jgi:prophage regulatory protein
MDRILRGPEVAFRIGTSQSGLYRLIASGQFPRPVVISPNCKGWPWSVVRDWIAARRPASRKAVA